MTTLEELVRILHLSPLPMEGGVFRETYRSTEEAGSPPRSLCTAIYYAYGPDTFSAMHRLRTDEVYHFYLGDPVEMLLLRDDGSGEVKTLGSDIAGGARPQVLVPGRCWQGSRLAPGGRVALIGTTMAPGFDFEDFTLGERGALVRRYPDFANMIEALTR